MGGKPAVQLSAFANLCRGLGAAQPASDHWDLSAELDETVSPHLTGYLRVENILDQASATLLGLPSPGRTLRSGLQGSF